MEYDAVLVVAFGGPEKPDDVLPFLENVTRGRRIPRERLLEVADHYHHFGGKSPLNDQVRALIAALEPAMQANGMSLPIFWGNRNWHPFLREAMQEMKTAGVRKALALVLAGYSSYSSCRQYQEDIARAREEVPGSPEVDKVRVFYNHPDFVSANAQYVREAAKKLPDGFHVAFTAHSIPQPMADGCDYEGQLTETARLIAEELAISEDRWRLVFQSRSGRPTDPWLEPDVLDYLDILRSKEIPGVVIAPIGFLSDHLEVLFDLDCEAREKTDALNLPMSRAATVGTDARFVSMLVELIAERIQNAPPRAIGQFPAPPQDCAVGCCPRSG